MKLMDQKRNVVDEKTITNFSFPSWYVQLDATANNCPLWLYDEDTTLLGFLGSWKVREDE